jgi:hypothetical protein
MRPVSLCRWKPGFWASGELCLASDTLRRLGDDIGEEPCHGFPAGPHSGLPSLCLPLTAGGWHFRAEWAHWSQLVLQPCHGSLLCLPWKAGLKHCQFPSPSLTPYPLSHCHSLGSSVSLHQASYTTDAIITFHNLWGKTMLFPFYTQGTQCYPERGKWIYLSHPADKGKRWDLSPSLPDFNAQVFFFYLTMTFI